MFTSHGKSGCNIEVVNNNYDFYLRKTSKTVDENSRHVLRIKKQINFYTKQQSTYIRTPQVLHLYEGSQTELSYVDMKYIIGKDSLSFLKVANRDEVDTFIKQLYFYLDSRLATSYENALHAANNLDQDNIDYTEPILKKVEQINKTLQFPRKELIIDKLSTLPKDLFLNGECHGDLTLANMIHANGKLYIFDFLDMYIDSPLFDLLSIRQDTLHHWSCFLHNDYCCRTVELLNYIDSKLKNRYSRFIENEWYNYFSLLNYVRMYRMYDTSKESRELNYIYNCITNYL